MNKKEKRPNFEFDSTELVPIEKSIVVSPDKSKYIDQSIIKKRFYNALNYTMLPDEYQKIQLTIGVTSPGKGEGKTLTAANLAVSFALAYRKKTVLIDMNMSNPCLHKIFGTSIGPGLMESFQNGSIFLSRTKLDHLYLLPAGKQLNNSFGLESVGPMRDILSTLRKQFEIIILDMNSVLPIDDFPAVCVNEVDGLMVVIDTQKTKYGDVEKMFNHIKKDQTLGFVFNKVEE
jgi:protein-tyrosine kinase